MKLKDALNNPENLSDIEVGNLFRFGLLNPDRTLTELSIRLLAGDKEASKEVVDILFPRPTDKGPEWVNPPVWSRQQRVFGPDRNSGEMAAFSIGFNG